MIKGVLCSTGAIITRFNGRDPHLIPEFAEHIESDGFEIMLYPSWYEGGKLEGYVDFLSGCGVYFPVLHADKSIGELLSLGGEENAAEARRRFYINCRSGERLGCSLMVLHLWGGPASDRDIDANIAELGLFTRIASEHGMTLTVENVVCANRTPLEIMGMILERYPTALFTVDTKMAEFHGELADTLACGPLFGGGHAAHMHINDYGGGLHDFTDLRVLHPGRGHVDFGPVFDRLRETGYSGYATCEATSVRQDGTIDFDSLNRSLGFIRKNLS